MNTTKTSQPLALGSTEGLGPLVEAAGMVNVLNHGSGSCVYSEGCHGVTQEHLERFAVLVRAAPKRCAVLLATLLQYARHPATPNAPAWVSFIVPDDFLGEADAALANALAGYQS